MTPQQKTVRQRLYGRPDAATRAALVAAQPTGWAPTDVTQPLAPLPTLGWWRRAVRLWRWGRA